MTILLACARLGTCQADSNCPHPSCFHAHLEGYGKQQNRILKDAESCAGHLGRIIQLLSAWAAEQHLTRGCVSVLAIDPRPPASVPDNPGLLVDTIPVPITGQ